MSKVKKLAEEFLAKHPGVFTTDFEANKKALDQLAIIRNRALRNQIAGAITAMAGDLAAESAEVGSENKKTDESSSGTESETIAKQAQ